MSESGDYEPAPYYSVTESFQSRRQQYDQDAGRNYTEREAKGTTASDLTPARLSTNSSAPLVLVPDVTGSMDDWPGLIFGKFPFLEHEARKVYLGADFEISFAAVGDARSDKYPFQARPFAKGPEITERLKELMIGEAGGGGQGTESYELPALYYARNVDMPCATKRPIIIFIADEGLYDKLPRDHAKQYAKVSSRETLDVKEIFEELKGKFSVYLIRKVYSQGTEGENAKIHRQWADLLGADHIAVLPSADRVLDVILGILAKEADMIEEFMEEIEGRQRPDQVAEAYKSLATIHALPPGGKEPKLLTDGKSSKSRLHGKQSDGPKSRPLV